MKLFHYLNTNTGHNEESQLSAEDIPVHNHDSIYYTKAQTDSMYALVNHNHNTMYYGKSEVDTKLSGKSDTNHTHSGYANTTHTHAGSDISLVTSNFNKNLTSAENTVQKAMDKLDDLVTGSSLPSASGGNGKIITSNDTGQWVVSDFATFPSSSTALNIANKYNQADFTRYGIYGFQTHLSTGTNIGVNGNTQLDGMGRAAVMWLWNNRTAILLKNETDTAHNSISVVFKPTSTTPDDVRFVVDNFGKIKSKNLAGTGEAPLKALADGTLARDTTAVITTKIRKTSTIPTSTADQQASVTLTYSALGITNITNVAGRIRNVSVFASNPSSTTQFGKWNGVIITAAGITFYQTNGTSIEIIPANSQPITINIFIEIE